MIEQNIDILEKINQLLQPNQYNIFRNSSSAIYNTLSIEHYMDFLIEIEYNIYDAFIDKWFLYIKYIVENKKYIHKKYIHNKINKKKNQSIYY